ncbi:MAG TPA: ParB/RepB/Spo0J family partition protein [Terriglobales bacterium]|nr:ParB/RepB/Spo0J family partition protein [Terriglobales bacterium]
MNATMAVSTTAGAPQVPPSFQELPLNTLQESRTNPRRQFDETKLIELAANIRQHGVLQPVLVRPLPGGEAGFYELVAGARRYRASKLAGRETIPATVRELTDTECLELQLIENLQRADVHELDEARGYAALMQLQPETYTVETLAEKIGRSEKYVYARLRLIHLVDEVQQAFYTGKLTVAHAFEIARLQPTDQQRALAECFPQHRTVAALLKDKKAEAVTVRELRNWIEREIHLDLANAPFDLQDETLLPVAGSCARCPKRTGTNPLLFPEVGQKKSICTDRQCYRAKVEALVQLRVKPLEESGEKPLRVSQAPAWQAKNAKPDVLHEGQYRRAQKKAECPQTKPAVVIDGPDAGKLLHVCRDEKCPVHANTTRYQQTPQERAERAKEVLAERIEKQTRVRILNAIRKKLPPTLSRPDLEMAALDYFERLGHDNHRRLCRVYGWDEKKTKAAWGGSTVDYKTIAGKAVGAMSAQEVQHFLIVCALVSDLYCPGYNSRQALGKDSNLARTALRYKIDSVKVSATVQEEVSKPTKKPPLKTNKTTKTKSK